MNTKSLLEKLENHKKLLSMISDKILPIKETLIQDTKNLILEVSSQNKKKGVSNEQKT